MATPGIGPIAPWITKEAIRDCVGLKNPSDDTILDKACVFASAFLFRATGRQYPGTKTQTVRPMFSDNCGCGGYGWLQWPMGGWSHWVWDQAAAGWAFPALPARLDGQWYNFGSCGGSCNIPTVSLPAPASLDDDSEVVIDGVVLDPAAYNVIGYQKLARIDGVLSWPCTQNLARDSAPYPGVNDGSRSGTWQITYTYGKNPGPEGLTACEVFACQVAKFLGQDEQGLVNPRIQTLVREGVTMDLQDAAVFIPKGGTGIYLVDEWIRQVNPGGLARRARFRKFSRPNQYQGFTGR